MFLAFVKGIEQKGYFVSQWWIIPISLPIACSRLRLILFSPRERSSCSSLHIMRRYGISALFLFAFITSFAYFSRFSPFCFFHHSIPLRKLERDAPSFNAFSNHASLCWLHRKPFQKRTVRSHPLAFFL